MIILGQGDLSRQVTDGMSVMVSRFLLCAMEGCGGGSPDRGNACGGKVLKSLGFAVFLGWKEGKGS